MVQPESVGAEACQVFGEVGDCEAAQAAKGQAPNGWILVPAVLQQHVDGKQHQFRVSGGVCGDVLEKRLLQHNVLCI